MSTALVTGANRGIGLEFCKQLKASNYDVIATCRKTSAELDALGVRVETGIDMSDAASIKELKQRLGETKIDLLINNAGIMNNESIVDLDFDTIQQQWEVNTLGPLRVVDELKSLMTNPSKIALITSRMGSIADNGSGGYYGYRMSKAALNMAGVSLAHDLKGQGIAVGILHPGFVSTDMTGNGGQINPDESVTGLMARIENLNLENSGTFWHMNGEVLPW
jgi:NAD(P)-dependent dehydrogenase (short-subunit alcohol dehydrogenase family)